MESNDDDDRVGHSTAECLNALASSFGNLSVPATNASCLDEHENACDLESCKEAIGEEEEQLEEESQNLIDITSGANEAGRDYNDQNINRPTSSSMCPPSDIPVPMYIDSRPSSSSDNAQGGDDRSVSSLEESLEEFPISSSIDRSPSKRIFAEYWNHAIEEEGSQMKHKTTTSTNNKRAANYTLSMHSQESIEPMQDEFAYQEFNRDFHNFSSNSTTDGYEEILMEYEIGRTSLLNSASLKDCNDNMNRTPQRKQATNKRCIFKNKYSDSLPSLGSYGYRSTNVSVRKTSSTSSLRKKQRSCLRSRSLSVDSTAMASLQSSSSRLSVSFDSKVCVHEYGKPLQRYTANGWSKWFA